MGAGGMQCLLFVGPQRAMRRFRAHSSLCGPIGPRNGSTGPQLHDWQCGAIAGQGPLVTCRSAESHVAEWLVTCVG